MDSAEFTICYCSVQFHFGQLIFDYHLNIALYHHTKISQYALDLAPIVGLQLDEGIQRPLRLIVGKIEISFYDGTGLISVGLDCVYSQHGCHKRRGCIFRDRGSRSQHRSFVRCRLHTLVVCGLVHHSLRIAEHGSHFRPWGTCMAAALGNIFHRFVCCLIPSLDSFVGWRSYPCSED